MPSKTLWSFEQGVGRTNYDGFVPCGRPSTNCIVNMCYECQLLLAAGWWQCCSYRCWPEFVCFAAGAKQTAMRSGGEQKNEAKLIKVNHEILFGVEQERKRQQTSRLVRVYEVFLCMADNGNGVTQPDFEFRYFETFLHSLPRAYIHKPAYIVAVIYWLSMINFQNIFIVCKHFSPIFTYKRCTAHRER